MIYWFATTLDCLDVSFFPGNTLDRLRFPAHAHASTFLLAVLALTPLHIGIRTV